MYLGVSIGTAEEMRSCLGGGGLGGVMDVLNAHIARRVKGILVKDIRVDLGENLSTTHCSFIDQLSVHLGKRSLRSDISLELGQRSVRYISLTGWSALNQ